MCPGWLADHLAPSTLSEDRQRYRQHLHLSPVQRMTSSNNTAQFWCAWSCSPCLLALRAGAWRPWFGDPWHHTVWISMSCGHTPVFLLNWLAHAGWIFLLSSCKKHNNICSSTCLYTVNLSKGFRRAGTSRIVYFTSDPCPKSPTAGFTLSLNYSLNF